MHSPVSFPLAQAVDLDCEVTVTYTHEGARSEGHETKKELKFIILIEKKSAGL